MSAFRWEIIEEYAPLFMDGALMTIKCTIICVILGTLWGLTLGLGRTARAERGPAKWLLLFFSAVSGAVLCQCIPWYAAVCTDHGGSLRTGAAVYQPA